SEAFRAAVSRAGVSRADVPLADVSRTEVERVVVDRPEAADLAARAEPARELADSAVAAFFAEVRREVVDSRTPESDGLESRAGMLAVVCFRVLEVAA